MRQKKILYFQRLKLKGHKRGPVEDYGGGEEIHMPVYPRRKNGTYAKKILRPVSVRLAFIVDYEEQEEK